jgi:4-amino-4-deoxy-L-arabinose transferase-like glycosyltransferase
MRVPGALLGLLGRRVSRVAPFTVGQTLAGVLTFLVVIYGAFLRFDAITLKYGPASRPSWLGAIQQTRGPSSLLRPAGVTWTAVPTYPHRDGPPTHYLSDPYTYLGYAREMRSFYAAHRREPLFPFVTRVFLGLLRNQDVAVSFASAAFSVLAIIATLALGWYAFSWWVGLGAALAMAIEYDVVSSGVEGWRDDAFMCAVVLSAYVMLRYVRVPSRRNALLVGIGGGLACLVRITALSFVLPGLAFLLVSATGRWRERLKGVGLAAVTMTAIVAPFAINCWLTFGDPLYAIDVHADVYRAAEGQKVETSQTASQYLGSQARSRPIQTLDTFVLGMTTYPFLNKWGGFAPWIPWLGAFLSWSAVAGVILLVGSPPGRLLLVVLAGSLVPYAFTWKLIGDWRFTEHAYPFFLIAACLAISRVVSLAAASRQLGLKHPRPDWRQVAFWGSVLAAIGVGLWLTLRVFPFLVARESLAANENVTVEAGKRDGAFFEAGWSRPLTEGTVTARVSEGGRSVVRLPLAGASDYDLTMRLDPFPRPTADAADRLPTVRIFVNYHLVAAFDVRWDPERVGTYEIHVPRNATTNGVNRLVVAPEAKPGGPDKVRLWYVRIRPVAR